MITASLDQICLVVCRMPAVSRLLIYLVGYQCIIGQDIATVKLGWPIGMPPWRSLTFRCGLWEVRSSLVSNRIGRVLFFVYRREMVLLHAFIKKSQHTRDENLDLAVKREKEIEHEEKAKK